MENYTLRLSLKCTKQQIFTALTEDIPQWWTKAYQGSALAVGDEFEIKFGNNVAKTMQVVAVTSPDKVVWLVKKAIIDIPQLSNKAEWVGTTISWTINEQEDGVVLTLEHIGFSQAFECFDICDAGWLQFTQSLKQYVETGQGNPYQ